MQRQEKNKKMKYQDIKITLTHTEFISLVTRLMNTALDVITKDEAINFKSDQFAEDYVGMLCSTIAMFKEPRSYTVH